MNDYYDALRQYLFRTAAHDPKKEYESGRSEGYFQTIDFETFRKIDEQIPLIDFETAQEHQDYVNAWGANFYPGEETLFNRNDLIDGIALNPEALRQTLEGNMPPMVFIGRSEYVYAEDGRVADVIDREYPEDDWAQTQFFRPLKDADKYIWKKNLAFDECDSEGNKLCIDTEFSIIYPKQSCYIAGCRYQLGNEKLSLAEWLTKAFKEHFKKHSDNDEIIEATLDNAFDCA